jgi:hypothetical protein
MNTGRRARRACGVCPRARASARSSLFGSKHEQNYMPNLFDAIIRPREALSANMHDAQTSPIHTIDFTVAHPLSSTVLAGAGASRQGGGGLASGSSSSSSSSSGSSSSSSSSI